MELTLENKKLLGRYECTQGGSYKFWQVKLLATNLYEVSWGKIGYSPQGEMTIDSKTLKKKAAEKLKKSYVRVPNVMMDTYHEKMMLQHEIQNNPNSAVSKKFKL